MYVCVLARVWVCVCARRTDRRIACVQYTLLLVLELLARERELLDLNLQLVDLLPVRGLELFDAALVRGLDATECVLEHSDIAAEAPLHLCRDRRRAHKKARWS